MHRARLIAAFGIVFDAAIRIRLPHQCKLFDLWIKIHGRSHDGEVFGSATVSAVLVHAAANFFTLKISHRHFAANADCMRENSLRKLIARNKCRYSVEKSGKIKQMRISTRLIYCIVFPCASIEKFEHGILLDSFDIDPFPYGWRARAPKYCLGFTCAQSPQIFNGQ